MLRRLQEKISFDFLFTLVIVLGLLVNIQLNKSSILMDVDAHFLINRAQQMLSCLKDGHLPYFYYDDFGGLGYGSSFFYGSLTIYPFLLLLEIDKWCFLTVYSGVVVILNWLGSREFARRYTKYYDLVSFVYMSSSLLVVMFVNAGVYCNLLGVGLSLFFLAKCVDFFRDEGSFIPCVLLFFLILNTHLISALFSFILCGIVCLYYFKPARIKEYFKFAFTTILLCSYFIINFFWHSDIDFRTSDILNKFLIGLAGDTYNGIRASAYVSNIPFRSTLAVYLMNKSGNVDFYKPIISMAVLIIFVCLLFKHINKIKFKHSIFLILGAFGVVYGTPSYWYLINTKLHTFQFQFPIRYIYYVILFYAIYCLRYGVGKFTKSLLIISGVVNIVFATGIYGYLSFGHSESTEAILSRLQSTDMYISAVQGEYLDKSFTLNYQYYDSIDISVKTDTGEELEYTYEKGEFRVKGLSDIQSVTFNKLYYRGYVAYALDIGELPLGMGDEQSIVVDTSEVDGTFDLVLRYQHPAWLVLLDFWCISGVVSLFVFEYILPKCKFRYL